MIERDNALRLEFSNWIENNQSHNERFFQPNLFSDESRSAVYTIEVIIDIGPEKIIGYLE